MPIKETRQLLRSAPYFPVGNLEQSVEHYERVLGFRREYVGGTPPQFAIMSRDGLPIMLRVVPAPERIQPNERQGGTWDAFFWVSSGTGGRMSSTDRSSRRPIGWRSSRCAITKAMYWDSGRLWRSNGMTEPAKRPRRPARERKARDRDQGGPG